MAALSPHIGELRALVRFDRRITQPDGYGNAEADWQVLMPRCPAKLVPTRGGEQVIAARLQGVSSWDLWVRFDPATSEVRPGDRVVDVLDPNRIFAVRFAQDMDGRRRWILMQLELGGAV
jgi:head-tail adaptor